MVLFGQIVIYFLDIYANDGLELKDGEELAKENGDAIAENIEKAKGSTTIIFSFFVTDTKERNFRDILSFNNSLYNQLELSMTLKL